MPKTSTSISKEGSREKRESPIEEISTLIRDISEESLRSQNLTRGNLISMISNLRTFDEPTVRGAYSRAKSSVDQLKIDEDKRAAYILKTIYNWQYSVRSKMSKGHAHV